MKDILKISVSDDGEFGYKIGIMTNGNAVEITDAMSIILTKMNESFNNQFNEEFANDAFIRVLFECINDRIKGRCTEDE